MRTYFTLEPIDTERIEIIKKIKQLDIDWEKGNQDWIIKKGKIEDVTITIYRKGKVLLQGKGIESLLNSIGIVTKEVERNVIGVDESGKGDFFGPLVTAAVLINKDTDLSSFEIKDSKDLKDKQIIELSKEIEKQCEVEISVLMPKEYNEKYKSINNLNILLANEHIKNINNLLNKEVEKIYIDKFANNSGINKSLITKAKIIEETKAENKYLSVACASIVARAHFVNNLEELSKDVGINLPKGAYLVEEAGKEVMKRYGFEGLNYVAKMHFKTTDKLLKLFI